LNEERPKRDVRKQKDSEERGKNPSDRFLPFVFLLRNDCPEQSETISPKIHGFVFTVILFPLKVAVVGWLAICLMNLN
jgi:hypothetical protein